MSKAATIAVGGPEATPAGMVRKSPPGEICLMVGHCCSATGNCYRCGISRALALNAYSSPEEYMKYRMALEPKPEPTESPAYVPQEYPKMVPGPLGPDVVQNAEEEYRVLTARIESMGPARWGEAERLIDRREELLDHVASPEQRAARAAVNEIAYRKRVANEATAAVEQTFDVDAWCKARATPSHDWIGALYRPYEPPV